MRKLAVIGALLFMATGSQPVAAQQDYDRDAALAISQSAIGEAVGNISFRDVEDEVFELQSLYGKPVVISLIYTSCHHVCPLITENIADNVDIAREALGDDAFTVVTIGFDWQVDTPERMRMYASGRRINDERWHFLSGDAQSVRAISNKLGFQYFPSAKGFDHLSQTTILDAEGRVYRQVYGVKFEAQAFVEPLKELVFDTPRDAGFVAHWVDTFKLFCTVYDPNSGRYAFDYSIFLAVIIGVLCLGAILTFVLREWRHAR